ncbi:MAG TPA: DUF72 domain-containing protein [Bryobacteraceae bacterium]|nr:DUF72 domain-containing protein [Bryobacteraceae bacterium]
MDGLFDEPSTFDRDALAERLRGLAAQGIYLGGSSWKYEGWIGQVYSRGNYLSRGRFSRQLFESTCLKEYAQTFPTVCGDFAFYQFPTPEFWARLFSLTPEGFRFAFKVPEQITCKVFPSHLRYGPQAGKANESFLDAEMLKEMFLRPLWPHRQKTALLIFEFGAFARRSMAGLSEFLDRLDPFLAALPPHFRYAVEVRNPEFLQPDYFGCLRARGIAHVYNGWSRMPELPQQVEIPGSATADFLVCRALLRPGRSYEDAVAAFTPYNEIRDPYPPARDGLRILIDRAREQRHMAFLFVNNRLEGNSPLTIMAVTDSE